MTVRRGRAVLRLDDDGTGVVVTHQGCAGAGYGRVGAHLTEGTQEQVRVAYVVAADGGRSTIRTQLGIQMEGKSFPQRWLVIDLRAKEGVDAFRHLPYFDFICDPALPTVSCPQPGGRHRFEFMLHDHDATEEYEDPATARALLAKFVDPDEVVVDRQLVYTFNALVATRWRDGRVLLAGDAAHMTPQFIGQGMNSGIRDADNLSWKLADVIVRGAHPSLLDSYQSERHPHAKAMIALSVFNKDVVSTGNPWAIRARDWGLRVGLHLPGLRRLITEAKVKPRPRFRRGAYIGMPRKRGGVEGTLMPQPRVRTRAGRPVRFDDVVGAGWVVIGVGIDPREALDVPTWSPLDPRWVTLFESGSRPQGPPGAGRPASGLVDLECVDAGLHAWLRRARADQGSVIVLRPDKYVFSVTSTGEHERAEALLRAHYSATRQEATA